MNTFRRHFCQQAMLGSLGLLSATQAYAGSSIGKHIQTNSGAHNTQRNNKRVIMFELFGANDNLNTLVPHKDPLYKHLRPTIGLTPKEYTPLNDYLALNNGWANLLPTWENGELAIVQDVGYENASLSHFKEIKTIDLAGADNSRGWIADVLVRNKESLRNRAHWALDAIHTGGNSGIFSGVGDLCPQGSGSELLLENLSAFNATKASKSTELNNLNLLIDACINQAAGLEGALISTSQFHNDFALDYDTEDRLLALQFLEVLRHLESGVDAPAFKIGMSGFDTHQDIRGTHEKLLQRAAKYLSRFETALKKIGEWDNTLIVVYSEFGRRPKENSAKGSDHGSAAPMYLLGGGVKGGIYGERAALDDLDGNNNIKHTMDYRRIYSSIVADWWQCTANPFAEKGHKTLPLFA